MAKNPGVRVADRLTVLAGSASTRLGAAVCEILRTQPVAHECRRFPDGEMQVEIHQSVRGRDVYLLQSTSPPVEQHLIELLLLADACRRAGAGRLTALIPYFGYARQDRRTERRSLGARVAANVVATAGFDRLMLIDAHTPAIEGFFEMPIDHLTAVPVLARAATPSIGDDAVVVAPDLGAVKLARAYARVLRLPLAIVHKTRLDGEEVEAHAVIGEVRHRRPLIVDDMLSTGGTIQAAVDALRAAGAVEPMLVADTVAIEQPVPHLELTSVAPLIATAIRRNHRDESLADLRIHM